MHVYEVYYHVVSMFSRLVFVPPRRAVPMAALIKKYIEVIPDKKEAVICVPQT